jgi:glycosyltransferase involved in cell wall biosynthesis
MKISIITVCYNAASIIEKTILSIINQQNHYDIEYIIIDGGSDDGTVDVISKYSSSIYYWVSEKDNGIYDAMNKGITVATGEFVIFINADDVLLNIPLNDLEYVIKNDMDGVCGCIEAEKGEIIKPVFDWRIKLRNRLPHQALFYRKRVMDLYDLSWKIVADYNLNLRLYNEKKRILLSNIIVSRHCAGISGTNKSALESYKVIKSNLGLDWMILSWINRKLMGLSSRFIKR